MKEINNLTNEKILKNLNLFNNDRKSLERYASFDYCFNYFQEKYKNGEKEKIADSKNVQLSCLQLGFYLASWGMYRGSTFLLQKSVKIFEPLIKYIAAECDVWDIDVNEYTDDNIKKLIRCGERIVEELKIREKQKNIDTLVTKIMLGVFGNVPAFDRNFRLGSNLGTFNEHSLKQIEEFYKNNSVVISGKAKEIKTLKYIDGSESKIGYTRAKIIDMIFFTEGLNNDSKVKQNKI